MTMFTEQQVAKLYGRYKEVQSLQALANENFCCYPTIARYFRKYGYKVNPQSYHKGKNVSMVLHDWNADVSINTIVDTYGFASTESCYMMIKKWRKKGYEFKKRNRCVK